MLNISNHNSIGENISKYSTFETLEERPHYKILNRIIVGVSVFCVIILFLPWTQNISGTGAVTTLKPDQRPQTIHAAIAGGYEKWYVKEGDFVAKGDTILFISEIKEITLDPNLIENTQRQLEAKEMSGKSYGGKVGSLAVQIAAIQREKEWKLQQAADKIKQSLLKIKSDSMDLVAVRTQVKLPTPIQPVACVKQRRLEAHDRCRGKTTKATGCRSQNHHPGK